jgi:2-methylcitrate dehydratase PrpD
MSAKWRKAAVTTSSIAVRVLKGTGSPTAAEHCRGFPGKPMTRADVERGFLSNLGGRTLQEDARAVQALDRTDDLRSLIGKLALRT